MRRLRADKLLESTQRATIIDILRRTTGAHAARIAREAQLSWTAASHHLRELEAAGFVRSQRVGRRRVYLLRDDDAPALALLCGPTCALVARAILATPGATIRDLSGRVAVSRRAVHYHVLRLREAGLATASDEPFRVEPTPLLRRLIRVS